MHTKIVYVSDYDGKSYDTEEECRFYEDLYKKVKGIEDNDIKSNEQ